MPAGAAGARNAQRRAKERAAKAEKEKVSATFKHYDKNGNGEISREELSQMLTELGNGTKPTENELTFIMKTSDTKPPEGKLGEEEFVSAISGWQCYQREFADPKSYGAMLFKQHDTDGSGKLNKEQLGNYLNDLAPATDEDVDWVMSQADVLKDGEVSKIELNMALGLWYQKKAEKAPEKSSVCALL
mmetsp:Transcript_20737/g.65409  ORF Transcript_20737/g.65409 Transcript_20737/m.65409 type:complete len:188 (+) Transcript_20737:59-622(+)